MHANAFYLAPTSQSDGSGNEEASRMNHLPGFSLTPQPGGGANEFLGEGDFTPLISSISRCDPDLREPPKGVV